MGRRFLAVGIALASGLVLGVWLAAAWLSHGSTAAHLGWTGAALAAWFCCLGLAVAAGEGKL